MTQAWQALPVRRLLLASLLFAIGLLASPVLRADEAPAEKPETLDFQEYVPGAAELEGRVIAPCCWTQTIDIHGSPAATELRTEIRKRLKAGESVDAIEHSLVDRYGDRILAVKPGSRLASAGMVLMLAMFGAGAGAVTILRRWKRRSSEHAPAPAPEKKTRDVIDERIDAELDELDRG